MRIEVDRVADEDGERALAADLERVLRDVREAVEDWPKMQRRALQIADEIEAEPPRGLPGQEVAETTELLRWLADRHFTFLGYREYVLLTEEGDPDDRLLAVPGSGLGILRADQAQSGDAGRLPRGVRSLARQRQLRRGDQGQQPLHGSPPGVPRLRRGEDLQRGRRGDRRAPVPRAVHLGGVQPEHPAHPGAAPQGGGGAGQERVQQQQPLGQGPAPDPGDLPARRAVPDRQRRPRRHRAERACTSRNAGSCGSSCAATPMAGSCPAWSTCRGTATRPRCATPWRRSCSRRSTV